ncbi:Holliday junction resolvase RuvX [Candidatus Cardinium hertigii]|uniref:Putative pre-16S rRNA nuclease n=1 Tax=Candidatus Cardinium hertigii TaxID=247481 RepID=A0A2Z3L8H9_9BACT|nr:Holliday junction resolvase RuvX [Candidatus Cardinium hertigii]AWN81731.1 Putative pre-16S rRNA nuclease [Candidatus Cardinium hertigii]
MAAEGRIIAIDYGLKRVGLAATDPLQLIAAPLLALPAAALIPFLEDYLQKEAVATFVIGMPRRSDGKPSVMGSAVAGVAVQLQQRFPQQQYYYQEERFTSKLAAKALYQAGYRKKDRQNKGNIDTMSAAIILQSFLYGIGQQQLDTFVKA